MKLLEAITPKNLESEKEKFLNSTKYHPVFDYVWQSDSDNRPLGKRRDLIEAIVIQDVESIQLLAKKHFQIGEWQFLERAKRAVGGKAPKKIMKEKNDYVAAYGSAFKRFGLDEYGVELSGERGFNSRIQYSKRKLILSQHADLRFFDIDGKVKHDMVHIIRYENGRYNNIRRSDKYLPTEEGLASLMQDTAEGGSRSEFQHAAEYVASSIGVHGSLRDIFDYFVSIGFGRELAWQRAARHKFGFVRTETSGDILKPAMYYENSQRVAALASSSIVRLFTGKISIEDLGRHPTYRGRFSEEALCEYFDIQKGQKTTQQWVIDGLKF